MEKEILSVKPEDDTEILETLDTIPKRLHYFAQKYPYRELFVFCSRNGRDAYTAGRLLDLAGKFAGQLLDNGFQPGDFLANSLPNSPERLITDLGAVMAGCATFNIPVLYADGADVYHMGRRSRCRGLIVSPTEKSGAWQLFQPFIADQSGEYSPVSCQQLPDMTTAVIVRPRYSDRPFIKLLAESNTNTTPVVEPKRDDVAIIFHSSGTTGLPKLVPKTHYDVLERGAKSFPIGDNFTSDRNIILFSERLLGWVGGFPFTTYAFGDTRIVLDSFTKEPHLEPAELYNLFVREQCNHCNASPTILNNVSHYITEAGLNNKKLFHTLITGGFPVRKSHVEMVVKLADTVVSLYGMSETFFLSQYFYKEESGEFTDCCCGKPLKFLDVEIRVEDQDGIACEPGIVGNVLVRGEGMFSGYLNLQEESLDPETTEAKRRDGWIDVGDYGYISNDGDLYVLGRSKECIIIQGMNFYPSLLEAKLLSYPGVEEAIVVPVSNSDKYQVICACLKSHDDSTLNTEKINEFCEELYHKGTNAMLLPVPKYYMILKESNFPLTVTGKPDKAKLRTMAEKLYGEDVH